MVLVCFVCAAFAMSRMAWLIESSRLVYCRQYASRLALNIFTCRLIEYRTEDGRNDAFV